MLGRMWRKRNTPPLLVGLQTGTISTGIQSGSSSENWTLNCLRIQLYLSWAYTQNAPTYSKDTSSTMFIAALFIIARSWKEPRCPSTEEWIQKMWYIYTMEYYSAIKNNEFMKFVG
ncbi:hypothetical protein, partial [Klebsiella pneumoniae]|uniref:hypothetical protein n=1 Tax=Klebsiella pneumoniae TaxID=573 RepID=UPI00259FE7BF